jgi:quaternary ammonium compound-resistance protein SugE
LERGCGEAQPQRVWHGQRPALIPKISFLFGLLRLVLRTQARSGACSKFCPRKITVKIRLARVEFWISVGLRLQTESRNWKGSKTVAWTCLVIAGLLEIGWAVGLKYTDGFSRLWPSVVTIAAMVASFALLAYALKTIPVGTGYAVWTGIGAAGTAIVGMIFLGESREVLRILCLVLIVAGVVGLKFASPAGH